MWKTPARHLSTPALAYLGTVQAHEVKPNWAALITVILSRWHDTATGGKQLQGLKQRMWRSVEVNVVLLRRVMEKTSTMHSCYMKINVIQMYKWMLNQHLCVHAQTRPHARRVLEVHQMAQVWEIPVKDRWGIPSSCLQSPSSCLSRTALTLLLNITPKYDNSHTDSIKIHGDKRVSAVTES